jgi:hypothetical protein
LTLLSGEEPDRCRGLNIDTLLCDELPHWEHARETFDLAMLALRVGSDPRCMVSTTPRRTDVLIRLLDDPNTARTQETTFSNRLHLAPQFLDEIAALYTGTRFAISELHGELPSQDEGAWFGCFQMSAHVRTSAEYRPYQPVVVGIDAGTSRHTAAIFMQSRRIDKYRVGFTIFGDYLAVDTYSGANAEAILSTLGKLAPLCPVTQAWIDTASSARTSIGPASKGEYETVFGKVLQSAPSWNVCDGLDMITGLLERGDLTIHPRCKHLISALQSYMRARTRGMWLDVPATNQSPAEDLCDALRYGLVGTWPEGRKPQPNLARVPAWKVL